MNISRRNFIRLSIAGVAGGWLAPRNSFASEPNGNPEHLAFTSQVAVDLASRFAEANYSEQFIASNPIPVIDDAGNHKGWSVDYFQSGLPHGYIIFDVDMPSMISRFSFSSDTKNLYESIASSSVSTFRSLENEPILVRSSPLDYGAADIRSGLVLEHGNAVRSYNGASLLAEPDKTEWKNLVINSMDIFGDPYTVIDENYIGDYWFVTEGDIERNTGTYACAVTALYTIAGLTPTNNGFLIDPFSDYGEYSKIWNYTGTYVYRSSGGIDYGLTDMDNIAVGFALYCSSKGHSQAYQSVFSPSFTRLKNQVNSIRHSLFSGSIIRSETGKESGHSMAVGGWATLKQGNSMLNTLYVFDGWYSDGYLNFSYNGYTRTHAALF